MHSLLNKMQETVVAVIGCGGLGGYVSEQLTRCKAYKLILVDYDVFDESNLNRQIFCNHNTIGDKKVKVAKEYLSKISDTFIVDIDQKFRLNTLDPYVDEIDVVIDCVDNVKTRLVMEEFCTKHNKPLVHGAINGIQGQVITIRPNSNLMSKLYRKGDNEILPTTACTASMVASLQVNEVIKIINNLPLDKELLIIDMVTSTFRKISI